MAENDPDWADWDRVFKHFDTDGDGNISAKELGDALQELGSVDPEEIKGMMAELDTDGDGLISFQEFVEFSKENRGLIKDVAKVF